MESRCLDAAAEIIRIHWPHGRAVTPEDASFWRAFYKFFYWDHQRSCRSPNCTRSFEAQLNSVAHQHEFTSHPPEMNESGLESQTSLSSTPDIVPQSSQTSEASPRDRTQQTGQFSQVNMQQQALFVTVNHSINPSTNDQPGRPQPHAVQRGARISLDGTPKPKKEISKFAGQSREWCRTIKFLPLHEVPDFCPPTELFCGHIPVASSADKYKPRDFHIMTENILNLSDQERKFVAAFNDSLCEQRYVDCKRRIFACHRWRTEEDGLTHNIESSQQVCSVDVKVSGTLHKWFDSMHLFDQVWQRDNTSQRPSNMATLSNATYGRNGRMTDRKCPSVPMRLS